MKKKITVNITFTRTVSDEHLCLNTDAMVRDFISDAVSEASADDDLSVMKNLDNNSLTIIRDGTRMKSCFSFGDFADFLEKYGKFISGYDIARVFNVYGTVKDISAKIEDIPDETKDNPAS